ncbi:S-layer homology domain-containing protein [Schinkia azotoformans]|uniref:S-layer homology domain-containing protein n=2 Tax=Schinkia azotoformans TaxID=1454 RepID=UPI002DB701C6|nr:S-layer homology domain-containing protein [Schinkia azotoformans]MEC1717189.1 S-layer homology domain-containing protein [Schinkia azotoformans]MEC1742003.1 S-layer homology domain-containing protein [Schinkia azotoformans]MEC1758244.1 S-layer homology domain-containing protein [Schinkia azotoformans]MEC1766355.1 S-layer homology domain-containing protein [Schinkia azotoformans]MEC1772992.1 S-layer homology domain-containing protein [Schinkia azotoformans]
MNKWVKKSLPLAVAASMAFTVIPGVVDAKSDNGKGNNNGKSNNKKVEQTWKQPAKKKYYLKDVETHWANQDIYKMYSLGLMSGYDDFTYQPNKPVTQLEVIASLVRVLELDGKDRTPKLSNKNLKDVPSWAKTSVAIAIEENLLDGNKNFQPNKPATRLFITNLLVQLVGNNIDEKWEDATPLFKDIDNLSKEEKAILAFASLTKLISGYSDNTFQPNKPVTRAEMAVFINRLLSYKEDLGDYYNESGNGTIVSIDSRNSEITIKQRVKTNGEWKYVNKEYTVDEDAKIYVDGKAATLSKLAANMSIEFTIDEDDNIIYIKAKSIVKEVKDYTYNGVITKVDNNIVWVNVDRVTVPFLINGNVKITTKSGTKAVIGDLKVDQKIAFNLNSTGAVSEILIDAQATNTNDEIKSLLNKLGDLNKIDLEIDGDNNTQVDIFFERKSNYGYEAQVKIVSENKRFELSGKTALTFLANFIENENIDFSDDDQSEVNEFVNDLIDEYNLTEADIDGVIVINNKTFNL